MKLQGCCCFKSLLQLETWRFEEKKHKSSGGVKTVGTHMPVGCLRQEGNMKHLLSIVARLEEFYF